MHLNLARPFENITEDFLYVVKALVQYLICKYVYGNLNAKMKAGNMEILVFIIMQLNAQ